MPDFDKAIDNVLAMVRTNVKPDEALKFTQSALNLAHAKAVLATIGKPSAVETAKTPTPKGAGA